MVTVALSYVTIGFSLQHGKFRTERKLELTTGESNSWRALLAAGTETRHDFLVHEDLRTSMVFTTAVKEET